MTAKLVRSPCLGSCDSLQEDAPLSREMSIILWYRFVPQSCSEPERWLIQGFVSCRCRNMRYRGEEQTAS
jgi:hypothetical protein